MTRNPLIYAAVSLLAASAWSSDRAPQAQGKTAETIPFCQLISHPEKYRAEKYRGNLVLLVDDQEAVKTTAVSHFYQFLAEHRRSSKPIFATITGRLVSGSEHGFVLKREYDFELESVSEVSEDNQSKHP